MASTAWTPRTSRRPIKPDIKTQDTPCERTVVILRGVILPALEPFPDAHRAMSIDFAQFVDPNSAT